MFVRLPIDIADPVDQLRRIRLETRDAKAVHGAIGANMIGDVTELTPPAIFNLASRMYSRAGLAERLPPIHNLVISNVPGPPVPLYVAGARVDAVYPFGPLIEGSGLNITVLSNMGSMDIGVMGCPDVAPHIELVAEGIVAGWSVSGQRQSGRRAPTTTVAKQASVAKKAAAKKRQRRRRPLPPRRLRSRRRSVEIVGIAGDEIPSIVAVLAAVTHDVAERVAVLERRAESVAGTAAIDAHDGVGQLVRVERIVIER